MKHNPSWLKTLFIFVMFFTATHYSVANESKGKEFPGRDLYPEVPYISLQDFYKKLKSKEIVVVDVRSEYEYNTLRMKDALNIPLASKTFVADMRKLRASNVAPIVVYCNGKTCMKSYQAVRKCSIEKIDNIISYDAGILDFAKAYPKDSILLGRVLDNPSRLISKEDFLQHNLSPEKFGERIADTTDIVLDVRDRFQREGISIFVGREFRVSIDNTTRLDRFIDKAIKENRALLIYDEAGKQVEWLQYYLEDKGLKSYFFMQGGISNYYKGLKVDLKKSVTLNN